MPQIKLSAEQFQQTVSERLSEACPSAVLSQIARGFDARGEHGIAAEIRYLAEQAAACEEIAPYKPLEAPSGDLLDACDALQIRAYDVAVNCLGTLPRVARELESLCQVAKAEISKARGE
jgi:hypothetical protein